MVGGVLPKAHQLSSLRQTIRIQSPTVTIRNVEEIKCDLAGPGASPFTTQSSIQSYANRNSSAAATIHHCPNKWIWVTECCNSSRGQLASLISFWVMTNITYVAKANDVVTVQTFFNCQHFPNFNSKVNSCSSPAEESVSLSTLVEGNVCYSNVLWFSCQINLCYIKHLYTHMWTKVY